LKTFEKYEGSLKPDKYVTSVTATSGFSQTGIDPSRLRAYKTSDGSGGYQTVRGEAQFIDDSDYQKTRSVYDEKRDDSAKSGTKGALPKR